MIDHLDDLLRRLLVDRMGLAKPEQVGFEPPNDEWATYVKNTLAALALNVYLVGFSENRRLRSNGRVREIDAGSAHLTPAPRRLDCHYLITAWSPAAASPLLSEPTKDEHALLYQAAAVLTNAEPLVPSRIHPSQPPNFPDVLWDAELPSELLPAEGFPSVSDFWSTLGSAWKPALQLTVTLPLLYERRIEGPMVTTRITEYRQLGGAGTAAVWIQIGGHVLAGGQPKPAAWVRLETPGGLPLQTAETDAQGRFTFADLAAGSYVLRVRAGGFAEATRNIDVPSPTGGYDVKLS